MNPRLCHQIMVASLSSFLYHVYRLPRPNLPLAFEFLFLIFSFRKLACADALIFLAAFLTKPSFAPASCTAGLVTGCGACLGCDFRLLGVCEALL